MNGQYKFIEVIEERRLRLYLRIIMIFIVNLWLTEAGLDLWRGWEWQNSKNKFGMEYGRQDKKRQSRDRVRRSMIKKDSTEKDPGDIKLWRSKISLGWWMSTVL